MPAANTIPLANGNGSSALAQKNGQQLCITPNVEGQQANDKLYHLGLSSADTDFAGTFGDLRFVCTGGSAGRMAEYARLFAAEARAQCSANLCRTDRYAMYKTGPVLWVNHGMGCPSLSILLCELFKLLRQAGAGPVEFIRLGTSGGIGVPLGTLVVSNGAMNGALERKHVQWIHGKEVKRDAVLHEGLGAALFRTAQELGIPAERGTTMCADDFYEGQMRLDGPFCEYGVDEKQAFLRQLVQLDVKNIEMESTAFAALTHRANVAAAICCVVIVNRLEGDTPSLDKADYKEFEQRPFRVLSAHMRAKMERQNGQTQNGSAK